MLKKSLSPALESITDTLNRSWWELEILKLSEVGKERQILYDATYIWNLVYSTNEPFHRKETRGLGEQTCGCQGGEGGNGIDWDPGVNRCKLLPLDMISCCITQGTIFSHL